MVLLHFKKTDHNQFLFEASIATPVDKVIEDIVEINNLRLVIDRLTVAIEDLANFGPLKPEALRGLTTKETIEPAAEMLPADQKHYAEPPKLLPGQRFNEDKTGYRTGVIQSEEMVKLLMEETTKAKLILSKDQVTKKLILNAKLLNSVIDNLRGAVMIAYPAYHGLPEWEAVPLILENKLDLSIFSTDNIEYLDPKTTSIWFAGKEMVRGKLLGDYSGKNEKTQLVVKLQKSGAGAPVREPPIDESAYKNMLAKYYKKQEESKKLEEDTDDAYMNSAWADPKGLKNQLISGGKGISWKPR